MGKRSRKVLSKRTGEELPPGAVEELVGEIDSDEPLIQFGSLTIEPELLRILRDKLLCENDDDSAYLDVDFGTGQIYGAGNGEAFLFKESWGVYKASILNGQGVRLDENECTCSECQRAWISMIDWEGVTD